MSWWRSTIKEVNDWALYSLLTNINWLDIATLKARRFGSLRFKAFFMTFTKNQTNPIKNIPITKITTAYGSIDVSPECSIHQYWSFVQLVFVSLSKFSPMISFKSWLFGLSPKQRRWLCCWWNSPADFRPAAFWAGKADEAFCRLDRLFSRYA